MAVPTDRNGANTVEAGGCGRLFGWISAPLSGPSDLPRSFRMDTDRWGCARGCSEFSYLYAPTSDGSDVILFSPGMRFVVVALATFT